MDLNSEKPVPSKRDQGSDVDLPRVIKLKDGSKCTLRTMTEQDAKELCAFLPQTHAESDFLNYLPGEFDKTVSQEREFIREHLNKPGSFAVVAVMDRHVVGIAGAETPPRKRYAHHAEFGLTVVRRCWGKGIGRLLTEYAVEWAGHVGLRKLELRVFAENQRAISLYRATGFVEEARLKDDRLRADGTYGDTVLMARFLDSS